MTINLKNIDKVKNHIILKKENDDDSLLSENDNNELKSLYLAKCAHELKNVFLSISSLVDINSPGFDPEEDEKSSNQYNKNKTHYQGGGTYDGFDSKEIAKRFDFLKSLCEFGQTFVWDINYVAQQDTGKNKSPMDAIVNKSKDKNSQNKYILGGFYNKKAETIESFNLAEAINFCVKIFKVKARMPDVDKDIKIKQDIQFIKSKKVKSISQVRFKQVIINLLSNAFKFTKKGTIEVQARAIISSKSDKIRILIRDTGTGFDVNQFKNFKPFHMLKENKSMNKTGSGLGLCIIQDILSKANSFLEIESERNKGSSFWFDIEDYYKDDNVINPSELYTEEMRNELMAINAGQRDAEILEQATHLKNGKSSNNITSAFANKTAYYQESKKSNLTKNQLINVQKLNNKSKNKSPCNNHVKISPIKTPINKSKEKNLRDSGVIKRSMFAHIATDKKSVNYSKFEKYKTKCIRKNKDYNMKKCMTKISDNNLNNINNNPNNNSNNNINNNKDNDNKTINKKTNQGKSNLDAKSNLDTKILMEDETLDIENNINKSNNENLGKKKKKSKGNIKKDTNEIEKSNKSYENENNNPLKKLDNSQNQRQNNQENLIKKLAQEYYIDNMRNYKIHEYENQKNNKKKGVNDIGPGDMTTKNTRKNGKLGNNNLSFENIYENNNREKKEDNNNTKDYSPSPTIVNNPTFPKINNGDRLRTMGGQKYNASFEKSKAARILICDDDPLVRKDLTKKVSKYLSSMFNKKGFFVFADDGIDCLSKLKKDYENKLELNLIFLDNQMPYLDGIKTCMIIRDIKEFKNIPIFIVSGDSNIKCDKANGCFDKVLTKPNLNEIFSQVEF